MIGHRKNFDPAGLTGREPVTDEYGLHTEVLPVGNCRSG